MSPLSKFFPLSLSTLVTKLLILWLNLPTLLHGLLRILDELFEDLDLGRSSYCRLLRNNVGKKFLYSNTIT